LESLKKFDRVIKRFWVCVREENKDFGYANFVFIKYFSFKKIGYTKTIATDFVER
jgi:hypothetical protein